MHLDYLTSSNGSKNVSSIINLNRLSSELNLFGRKRASHLDRMINFSTFFGSTMLLVSQYKLSHFTMTLI